MDEGTSQQGGHHPHVRAPHPTDLHAPLAAPLAAPFADIVIAIDGPSGAGKSSVSRGVAHRLGLRYLDTGSTYRALTWWMLERGIDVHDADAVAALAEVPQLEVGTDPAAPAIRVDGRDVAREIRQSAVTAAVSPVSAVPAVRRRLADLQRSVIGSGGIVVEGRDIATVVAPDAPAKIYLTASAEARAQRRNAELPGGGRESTRADLERRDRIDSTRAAAPLAKAADAREVDATALSLPEVIEAVLGIVAEVTGSPRGRENAVPR